MQDANYTEAGFWSKAASIMRSAGRTVLEPAFLLYYAAQRPETPAWAKGVVYGALAYLILPLDAIPDAIPVLGFTDDLGVIAAAVTTIAAHIDDDVRRKAREKQREWFGAGG